MSGLSRILEIAVTRAHSLRWHRLLSSAIADLQGV